MLHFWPGKRVVYSDYLSEPKGVFCGYLSVCI